MNARILVVEDNVDNMKLTSWALEDAGYDFVGADSAEQALGLLERHMFDLVLMDISLPGMDGKEATRRLRADPRFATLPIVAVTAHAIRDEEQAIRSCGVNDMLTKPIDETRLLRTVEKMLRTGGHHGKNTRC